MTVEPEGAGDYSGDLGDTTILGTPRDDSLRPIFGAVAGLFIALPILNLISTGASTAEAVLVLIATVVFAGLMIWTTPFLGVRTRDHDAQGLAQGRVPTAPPIAIAAAAVVVMLAIAVILGLAYPGASWFALFYYASTGASTIRSTKVAISLMIVAGVAASLTFFAVEGDIGGAVVQGLSVTIIGFTVYSAIAVRRTNRALVAARHELTRLAVADERARIARDLHDTLGHSLTVIALKSELAGRLVDDDPARAKIELADVEHVARESLAAVRETITGYRQPSLAAELVGARTVLAAAGIEGRVESTPEGIPSAVDAILGWAVREGVTNIVRHGRAGSAEIRVALGGGSASVDIWNDRRSGASDDAGVGGVVELGPGSGLAGLRERVARFNGVVDAAPTTDGGFRLHVSVPIT